MSYQMELINKENVELNDFMKSFIDGREYKVVDVFVDFIIPNQTIRFYPTAFYNDGKNRWELDEITWDITGFSQDMMERIDTEARELMVYDMSIITDWVDGLLEEFGRY